MGIIIAVLLLVLIIIFIISAQRNLVLLDENVKNAMNQIGVVLSSRWDALTALSELTKGYAEHEYKTISDAVKMRTGISRTSTPEDVTKQENAIVEAMGKIVAVAESYPDLKANQNYIKAMDSVNSYEDTVRRARLVYNDSVTKLNRKIRMFPTSLVAGMLGFKEHDYLETDNAKSDMPSMR